MGRLFCLFLVLLLIILIQNKCDKEGFFGLVYNSKECIDDKNWYVDSGMGKKTCKDIGKGASCYDRDAIGREGWERCQKTCGNCSNTKVTKAPMNILAGFSGDPYEDFGVVLHKSKDRQWVGKTASEDEKDDIRGYVMGKEQGEAIDELDDKVSSMEDIFDMITGNVKKCGKSVGQTCKTKDGKDGYKGCGGECFPCKVKNEKDDKHSYIKQVDGNIQFPAYNNISCKDAHKLLGIDKVKKSDGKNLKQFKYEGCFSKEVKSNFKNIKAGAIPVDIKCDTHLGNCVNISKFTGIDKIKKCADICNGDYKPSLPTKEKPNQEYPLLEAWIHGGKYPDDRIEECCKNEKLRGIGDNSWGNDGLYKCSHRKDKLEYYPPFVLTQPKTGNPSCCNHNGDAFAKCQKEHPDKQPFTCKFNFVQLTKFNHPDCDAEDRCYKTDPPLKDLKDEQKYFTKSMRNSPKMNEFKKHINDIKYTQDAAQNNFGMGTKPMEWYRGGGGGVWYDPLVSGDVHHRNEKESLSWHAKKYGKCYITEPPLDAKNRANFSLISDKNECLCGNEREDFLKHLFGDANWRCGVDGSTPKRGGNSIYSLKIGGQTPVDNIYDLYESKPEGKPGGKVSTCDNYFLFDKLADKANKKGKKEKGKKEKDKRITLGDMCPKQCHKKVCK